MASFPRILMCAYCLPLPFSLSLSISTNRTIRTFCRFFYANSRRKASIACSLPFGYCHYILIQRRYVSFFVIYPITCCVIGMRKGISNISSDHLRLKKRRKQIQMFDPWNVLLIDFFAILYAIS